MPGTGKGHRVTQRVVGHMVALPGLRWESWFAEKSRKGAAFAGGIQIWVQSKCHLSPCLVSWREHPDVILGMSRHHTLSIPTS